MSIAAGKAIKMAEEWGYYQLIDLENFKKLFVDCNEETLKELNFGKIFKNTTGPAEVMLLVLWHSFDRVWC